jgi:hypothetical protein
MAWKIRLSFPPGFVYVFSTRVLAAFLGARRKSGLRADDESLFPPRACKN